MTSQAGKVYIVTGGGSGIGRATALQLVSEGASVTVVGRRLEPLDSVVTKAASSGGQVLAVQGDVRDPATAHTAVERTLERFGGVDGLVSNAAGNFVSPAEELSDNGWKAVVDIVLNGTWYFVSAVARELIRAERPGAIVSIVATYAWTGHPGTVHSAAAKAGVVTMTRTLAAEWARFGIRVNCLAPGPTETEGAGAALWATQGQRESVLASVPMRRFASPEEIADLASLMLSDRTSYVTGEVLTADGGQSLGRQVYGESVVPSAGRAGSGDK